MAAITRTPWPFPAPSPSPAAAPAPTVRERALRSARGSSAVQIEFRGTDRAAVHAAATARAAGIDFYRSPAVQAIRAVGDEWVCVLRYYNVD